MADYTSGVWEKITLQLHHVSLSYTLLSKEYCFLRQNPRKKLKRNLEPSPSFPFLPTINEVALRSSLFSFFISAGVRLGGSVECFFFFPVSVTSCCVGSETASARSSMLLKRPDPSRVRGTTEGLSDGRRAYS